MANTIPRGGFPVSLLSYCGNIKREIVCEGRASASDVCPPIRKRGFMRHAEERYDPPPPLSPELVP